jgi:ParB family chromosome partitioning protein
MGRGLAAILPPPEEIGEPALRDVPIDLIRANASQPRTQFDAESIAALAESIAAVGVLQPLIVRPLGDGRYELVAGERRWRAAQSAGLETVPALIGEHDERRRLETALIENVAREDLSPIEEARACATLVEDLGISKEELARRLGRSRPAISNLIRLLDLPPEALELIGSGALTEGHGRAILQARGADVRKQLARDAARAGWSVRETERRAKGEGRGRRVKVVEHPDQAEMLARAEEELESALGHGVRVRAARRGISAELHFDDLSELEALAARLRGG